MTFTVFSDQCLSLSITNILDSLLGLQMEFNPVTYIISVDKTKSMAAKAVHMAVCCRDSTIAHYDGDLV